MVVILKFIGQRATLTYSKLFAQGDIYFHDGYMWQEALNG